MDNEKPTVDKTETQAPVASHGAHFAKPASGGPTRDVDTEAAGGVLPVKTAGGRKRRGGIAALVALGCILAIYLGGVALFSSIFMPNTTINSEDVSFKSPAAVAQAKQADMESYSLSISGDSVALVISGASIGLSLDADAYAQDAMAQLNPWAWPASFFGQTRISSGLDIVFDAEKLDALIEEAVGVANEGATQPEDARAVFDEDAGSFVIEDEVLGSAVDASLVETAATKAIEDGEDELVLGEDELMRPEVTSQSPELASAVDTANSYLGATQTLTANGETAATVGAPTIASWVSVEDDLSVRVDKDAIQTWAQDELAPTLDTVGTERSYELPTGKQVTVSDGTYGWSVDAESLASTLAENIGSATPSTFEVPWTQTAAVWNPGGADWGDRYIDADLTDQHARFYDGGSLIWESDFVSGDTTEGRETPIGVYTVDSYKGTNQTLKGLDENHDGEPDYISYVSYWIPFIGNLVAFHDASWRVTFGGTIYQGNGSHGCINLPKDAAAELYDLSEIGDVVVVHY